MTAQDMLIRGEARAALAIFLATPENKALVLQSLHSEDVIARHLAETELDLVAQELRHYPGPLSVPAVLPDSEARSVVYGVPAERDTDYDPEIDQDSGKPVCSGGEVGDSLLAQHRSILESHLSKGRERMDNLPVHLPTLLSIIRELQIFRSGERHKLPVFEADKLKRLERVAEAMVVDSPITAQSLLEVVSVAKCITGLQTATRYGWAWSKEFGDYHDPNPDGQWVRWTEHLETLVAARCSLPTLASHIRDTQRLNWFFAPDHVFPAEFTDKYSEAVNASWTLDQWRQLLDWGMTLKEGQTLEL